MSKVNYANLVKDAISSLKERGGSSLQAIKKYAAGNKIEIQNVSLFITTSAHYIYILFFACIASILVFFVHLTFISIVYISLSTALPPQSPQVWSQVWCSRPGQGLLQARRGQDEGCEEGCPQEG